MATVAAAFLTASVAAMAAEMVAATVTVTAATAAKGMSVAEGRWWQQQ